jgi:hypothetical protein
MTIRHLYKCMESETILLLKLSFIHIICHLRRTQNQLLQGAGSFPLITGAIENEVF